MSYRDMISGLGPPAIPLGEKVSKEEEERMERGTRSPFYINRSGLGMIADVLAGRSAGVSVASDGTVRPLDSRSVSEAAAKTNPPSPTLPEHNPLRVSGESLRSGGGSQSTEDAAAERDWNARDVVRRTYVPHKTAFEITLKDGRRFWADALRMSYDSMYAEDVTWHPMEPAPLTYMGMKVVIDPAMPKDSVRLECGTDTARMDKVFYRKVLVWGEKAMPWLAEPDDGA